MLYKNMKKLDVSMRIALNFEVPDDLSEDKYDEQAFNYLKAISEKYSNVKVIDAEIEDISEAEE